MKKCKVGYVSGDESCNAWCEGTDPEFECLYLEFRMCVDYSMYDSYPYPSSKLTQTPTPKVIK